jgi:hypothetical protein
MKRWFGKLCATGLLAGVLLSTGSCADNENMLVIIGAMSAKPPDCTYTAAASSLLLFTGTVDMAFGGRYTAVLLVSNQLASRGSKARLRAESSDVTIDNAVVNLLGNGATSLNSYSVPASGHIPVGTGEDVGYGAISVDIMPGGVEVDSTQTGYIIAEIKLQGKTSGGVDIESNVFRFEIYVVNSRAGGTGGLVSYTDTDASGLGFCDPVTCGESASSTTRTSCYIGQDTSIYCCDCYQYDICKSQ